MFAEISGPVLKEHGLHVGFVHEQVLLLLDLIYNHLLVYSPCEVTLQGEILLEFSKLIHSFDGPLNNPLLLQDDIIHLMSLIDIELVIIMVHLVPLLVNHLLPYCRCFHAISAVLDLLIYPLVVFGHDLVQFLVAVLV